METETVAIEPVATLVSAGDSLLQVDSVIKSFGGLHAVDGATFSVREGSITALIGPNGAGKTTLFNVITGFYRGEGGSIRFGGRDLLGLAPHAVADAGIVRTFQITKALARMSVIDNVMLAAKHQNGERLLGLARPGSALRREREVSREARELLEDFDLGGVADSYAGTLSGGQRKLLELARAVMTHPAMLLLDEPMAGVNPTLGRRLLERIQALRSERGVTVLFIEHDMDAVMTHSDTVIVMADGRVICQGPPERVRTDQAVIDAYLGTWSHGDGGGEPT